MSRLEDTTAVIGMGQTGQSVVRFLQSAQIPCEGHDENPCELPPDLNVPLHIGSLDGKKISQYKQAVVSPGIPWTHPALRVARQNGLEMNGDLALFVEHYQGDILAVTGTNGKTTTVSLITLLLETLPGGIECGGNTGTPMLNLLAMEPVPPRVVLELSSFQLERTPKVRPRLAVLLNVQPDHADMHEDHHQYAQAKLSLFAQQGQGDIALLPLDKQWNVLANELQEKGATVQRFGWVTDSDNAAAGLLSTNGDQYIFWHQNDRIQTVNTKNLKIRGSYQYINLAIAAQAAAQFGVSSTVIRESIISFQGLPHRLQSLGVHADREWIDDSKATNPAAAMAALGEFENVIWICGGLPKELDLMPMQKVVKARVRQAFVIGKNTKPFEALLRQSGVPATCAGSIGKAVGLAASEAPCPVLLSPAAASQDQFRNYVQRGQAFAKAVAGLETRH